MNNKTEWVTSLKSFGIIAVILGHIATPFSDLIYSWHMPLFFMISGFFINSKRKISDLVVKDWKRLMVPFFIFSFIAIILTSFKIFLLGREQLNYTNELFAVIYWMDYKHLINTYGFVLWFLPTLFFAKQIYYIITTLFSSILIQICFFVFVFISSFYISMPFAFSNAMNSVLWVFSGSLLFSLISKINDTKCNTIIVLLAAVIAVFYIYFGIPKLDMAAIIYEDKIINVLWAFLLVVFFSLFFKIVTAKYKNNNLIKLWGEGTMLLFILHPYTNNIANIIVEKIKFGDWPLKLLISLVILHCFLMVKKQLSNRRVFKYV